LWLSLLSVAVSEFAEATRKLADLAVGFGANVQPGQIVGVTTFVGKEELAREIVRSAYEHGACFVDVLTYDPWVKRERIALAPDDSLEFVAPWQMERLEWLSSEGAARVTINGPAAPRALDGLDPARAGRDITPYLPNSGDVVNRRTTNWCIVPGPTVGWAERVYPDLEPEAALRRLWEATTFVCRLDADDPVRAWLDRFTHLTATATRLSERRFDAIRLHGPGTDLTVGLFRSSLWNAADFERVDGLKHYPNIPSEEMFTTPDPDRVDGYVSTTMPKELYGSIIDGVRLEFANGRVVKVEAERGADALRSVIAKDEGARRVGELALVDGEGRIGQLNTVFFETLLDENAASHIALGNAYGFMVGDDAERARANKSTIHVDLMVGSPELEVDGITTGGETVPVLRQGAWQI
jgi:aminopeptidase